MVNHNPTRRPRRRLRDRLFLLVVALASPAWAEDPCAIDWPHGAELDAVAAAPESHVVLHENERLRILEVVIPPGVKEPMHTHRWSSVMFVDSPARIRYFNADDHLVFETPADREPPAATEPSEMGPEGLHAVENIDTVPFHAVRVELKCREAPKS